MNVRLVIGLAAMLFAISSSTVGASIRGSLGMRLVCRAPGKTTLYGIPTAAKKFKFTFWDANGSVSSGPAWYDRSLVRHRSLWIYTMRSGAFRAMARVRMSDGTLVRVRSVCS